MRIGIIARVSTRDQDAENQLQQMRQWCRDNGHVVFREYVDVVSGGKGLEKRPQLQIAFADAMAHKYDMALFWSLDRLTRGGLTATVTGLQRFGMAGVQWRSHAEPYLDTTHELVRDILLACLAALAKQERVRIGERTKAGLERVRREGSKSGLPIGRPALPADTIREIADLAAVGATAYAIAKRLKLARKTVVKYLGARADGGAASLPVQNAA